MDSVRSTTAFRRSLLAIFTLLIGALVLLPLTLTTSTAHAEESAPPAVPSPVEPSPIAPSPAPQPAEFEITSPADGDFVGSATVTVSGTRSSDAGVRLSTPDGMACELPANDSTNWSCEGVALPSGESVTLLAEAMLDGAVVARYEQSLAVLQPPIVSGGATSADVSNGVLRGTGYPGASVTATLDTGHSCGFDVDSSGAWSCLLPSGIASGSYTVSATQTAPFANGARSEASSVELRIDSERPAAPSLATTEAEVRPGSSIVLSGRGESGADVTVFSGPSSLCEAPVEKNGWSCTVILGLGTHSLRAVQQDAAGNLSEASDVATLIVAGGAPAPAPKPSVKPTVVPTADPSASTPPSSAAPELPPSASPSGEAAAPAPPKSGAKADWNEATNFARVVSVAGDDPWLWPRSLAIALSGLLLLAIPARLLANALGSARNSRLRNAFAGLAGRNRATTEFEVAPALRVHPWLMGAAVVIAASCFAVLARPVDSQPAYLRLLLAVACALVLVNVVVVATGMLAARWRWGVATTPLFAPRLLLLVAASSLLSRLLELSPPLLFGVIAGVGLASVNRDREQTEADTRENFAGSGVLASARIVTLIVLGATAWFVAGLMPATAGFGNALLGEFVGTVALASLGSATIMLLPLGTFDGRVLFARSPLLWVGLTVLAGTLLAAALTPSLPHVDGVVTLSTAVIALVFAAACVAVWSWSRFRTPGLR